MELNTTQIEKIDPRLQSALKKASGDEVLRAVVMLGRADGEAESNPDGPALDPSSFQSRADYKQELINQQRQKIADGIGETLRELKGLSLVVHGGEVSRVVVAEGPARQILASLDIPGVRHASLDQRIQLIEPRRRRHVKARPSHKNKGRRAK